MADEFDFEIKSDSPAADELMFWRVTGHEGLSRPSLYELNVLSKNERLDAKDILGRSFDVVIQFLDPDGTRHERHCHGFAVRFSRLGAVGRLFEYRIQLRSWFWLLQKRRNSRILQDKPVLDVLNAVFDDSPISRVKKLKTDGVIGVHPPRRYCVQHQESDYSYLSRLMEEEGIYYWFDAHDAPGTMMLADSSAVAHQKLPVTTSLLYRPESGTEGRFNEITRWVAERRFDTGKHDARDSNFKTIRQTLGAQVDATDNHELADFEDFEFPGGYFTAGGAEDTAKIRGDELTARRDRHWALTQWPDVAVGRQFKFENDPDGTRNGEYLIAGCTFVATHPGYESLAQGERPFSATPWQLLAETLADDAINHDSQAMMRDLMAQTPALATLGPGHSAFLLTLLPADMPFRPPRLTPQVRMPGPQSAIVVGAAGKEIDTDAFGRVKVHFHWDRYGKSNEKSTCWVRVSQPWGGKGWGGYFIPRIGQEVIVDFLNGDPNRPVVVGRVYNSDQPIPYQSPTQSGFKTRSTPGGDSTNYNEIMFEDKKGEENINIHAERNMSTSVEWDQTLAVSHDRTSTIDNDDTLVVYGHRKTEISKTLLQAVADKVTFDYRNGELKTVDKGLTEFIYDYRNIKVDGWRHEDVTGLASTQAGDSSNNVNGAYQLMARDVVVIGTATMGLSTPAFTAHGESTVKLTSGGSFDTGATGAYKGTAASFKFVTSGNFDRTIAGEANDCILGKNSNAYIGMASDFNVALARSTFIGMQLDNTLAVSISNFVGAKLENEAAIDLKSIGAAKVEQAPVRMAQAAAHLVQPGAGGGGAGGAGTAAAGPMTVGQGLSIAFGAIGIGAGVYDFTEALSSYDTAITDLRDAGFPEMARLAATRRNQLAAAGLLAAGGLGGAVGAGVVASVVAGTSGLSGADPNAAPAGGGASSAGGADGASGGSGSSGGGAGGGGGGGDGGDGGGGGFSGGGGGRSGGGGASGSTL
ncbi:type VI secretion system tip protein TssI/VgrG [Xenophilus arseniciresistens]|uniref:Type VI secretion system tip protein TssI/VgrG n=1 Tax=Xenophilus arseniciresistens TaxID=1283306 RepID=A0AAE3NAI6_9BURK|nr:type VI secretion system tip protein TssI/VgrG [Xenophilus arseniciresistens]MDA7418765.1 type VI secretion system tip protein TssI/VgrG [Xenophilus arseniciresistens]